MALIALPAAGIIVLLAVRLLGPGGEVASEAVDHNRMLQELRKEVPALVQEFREVFRLIQEEAPSAEARARRLKARIDAWKRRWEEILAPLRGPNGELPPEYKAFEQDPDRAKVNRLALDLAKVSNF